MHSKTPPNRAQLQRMGEEAVAISEAGHYQNPLGEQVGISHAMRACLDATRSLAPEALRALRTQILSRPAPPSPALSLSVANETTLAGVKALLDEGATSCAALNFASARKPGGGFLNGAQAQEESLARSSGLHASLLRAPDFYARHAQSKDPLYSDAMILSPGCPIFRDDSGALMETPMLATFITAAAPNKSAIPPGSKRALAALPQTLLERSELTLALAVASGARDIVLGAWGCGVFANDPDMVAQAFASHLLRGPWGARFERVRFSVLDPSPDQRLLRAFQAALNPAPTTAAKPRL